MKQIRSNKNEMFLRRKYGRFNRFVIFRLFLRYVVIKGFDECWEWNGSLDKKGYGCFIWQEKGISLAHIASYELFIGKRHGLCVLHSCDNRKCVNPNHLWLGTRPDNVADMISKGRAFHPTKLTFTMADRIRRLYDTGKYTQAELSKKFSICTGTISEVINLKKWIN